ncbi:MAG: IS1595 family transposase [Dehalococcoidia bacterium]
MQLMKDFDTDKECRDVLEDLRWPEGVACPRCEGKKIYRAEFQKARQQFDCASCGYQFSVTVGTIFQDSKLPLPTWFAATFLLCEAKKGMSSNQLKRTLGVSYKTAWYLSHRIRAAMKDAAAPLLQGTIEADEHWVGGRQKGAGKGNWRDGKTMVLGAVARGGEVRLKVDKRATKKAIHTFLTATVSPDADALYTDEHGAYVGWVDADTRHEHVVHRKDEWVRGEVHTNSIEGVWSLMKRSVIGSYHQLSEKHLQSYVDEMAWRFNNRDNPYLFRDTLIRLIRAETLPYQDLIAEA